MRASDPRAKLNNEWRRTSMHAMKGTAVAALVLLGILAVGAVVSPPAQSQQGKPIVIGAHGDQAKQASYYTLLYKDTIEVFLEEFNANGGVGRSTGQVHLRGRRKQPG